MSEQRARDAVDHLQAAAIEVIEALRALLDVAEEVVRDPAQAAALVQSLAETARAADGGSRNGAKADVDRPGDVSGVTRIRVS